MMTVVNIKTVTTPTNFNQTDLSYLFNGASEFHESLSVWDTSSTITTEAMFNKAHTFNQSLNEWSVGNVKAMNFMFSGASAFNQQLNRWDVSNVTTMSAMFNSATSFNQSLNDWDVSSVIDMGAMFNGATNWKYQSGSVYGCQFLNRTVFYYKYHWGSYRDLCDVDEIDIDDLNVVAEMLISDYGVGSELLGYALQSELTTHDEAINGLLTMDDKSFKFAFMALDEVDKQQVMTNDRVYARALEYDDILRDVV